MAPKRVVQNVNQIGMQKVCGGIGRCPEPLDCV